MKFSNSRSSENTNALNVFVPQVAQAYVRNSYVAQ